MAQDRTPSAGGVVGGRPYNEAEAQAMSLAGELRERVHRERQTVAELRAYLSGSRTTPSEPLEQLGQ